MEMLKGRLAGAQAMFEIANCRPPDSDPLQMGTYRLRMIVAENRGQLGIAEAVRRYFLENAIGGKEAEEPSKRPCLRFCSIGKCRNGDCTVTQSVSDAEFGRNLNGPR